MPDKPRLGFVGLGWIGRHRLEAVRDAGVADIVALADIDATAVAAAQAVAPSARALSTLESVLAERPDGVVLATPSARHADEAICALQAGAAVFCQKPLGRNAAEVRRVVYAARSAERLLKVDVSYRYTEGLSRLRDLIRTGAIGRVFAIDLVFHNAFGPDKPWFYDFEQSGGGCLLDLGTHLVDFLHWAIEQRVVAVSGHRFAGGVRLTPGAKQVEDYALGEIEFAGGTVARLACSWRVSAGVPAQIAVSAFGTSGGLGFRNVDGSFYDFVTERYSGTTTEHLCGPPDLWGGRAAVAWAQQLAQSNAYDPDVETSIQAAATLDALYGRNTSPDPLVARDVDLQHAAGAIFDAHHSQMRG